MNHYIYTPASLDNLLVDGLILRRDDLLAVYYHLGYTVQEILGFLAVRHNIAVSERHAHRILRAMNLMRRNNHSTMMEIIVAIIHELSGTGQNIGYRSMRRRLLVDHGIIATSDSVRLTLSVLDAEGVLSRSRRSLRRRTYINNGPNYAIHIDGWDKLKPFGVSVHGAVDGFSRRVLWLRACDSNKKPQYVVQFYIDFVKEINGIPMIIYADRGTENSTIRDLQYALRWDHLDPFQGLSSFIYGSSTRNTRIERFWRSMRDMCGNTWINHFKDMADVGILDTSDRLHLECVRYCFLQLINDDLKRVTRHWNEHRIRQNRNLAGPVGKPDVLYFQPEIFLSRDYKLPLTQDIDVIEEEYGQNPPVNGVSEEFDLLARNVIMQNGIQYQPNSIDEATKLFVELIICIEQIH